jgi:flagellum-specific peptidoglycan hydrolase FlgJ
MLKKEEKQMTNDDFIKLISNAVCFENKKRGYPLFSSVVIAQAILETGWGKSNMMMKANAVFGIKATSNWNGKVYNAKTYEVYDGKIYNITGSNRFWAGFPHETSPKAVENSVENVKNLVFIRTFSFCVL